jgi:cytochrome c
MHREKLLHIAIGAAIAIALLVPLGAYAFIKSGLFDVAAFKPHTRFTEWVTHETMINSVKRHAKWIEAPERFTPEQVAAGFCQYETHCVACHGAAGVARQHWPGGMEPAPPYLLDVQQRFSRPQLFWIVQNGIKMTGMPSWRETMSEPQMWDVVAWLEASPKLPPQTYVRWQGEGRCAQSKALPGGERAG